MTRTLAVVSAGLSDPSSTRLLADRLAEAVTARLRAAGEEVLVEVVELRPLAHALADHLLTGFPNDALASALRAVTHADAVVAVTPVFSASYSGLFKTFFDLLEKDALSGTPVLVAATAGTARHSLVLDHALRPLFAYLRAQVVPTGVFAATEDFGGGRPDGRPQDRQQDRQQDRLGDRVTQAAQELADLVAGRPARTVPEHGPFGEVTPFSDLLGGGR